MAEILAELGDEIDVLGTALCGDANFAALHTRELQAIDLIAQTQHVLAMVLAANLEDHAVAGIGIDLLRRRLAGAMPQAQS